MPEQYGNVFRLSVLEGLSHKEIGAILGIAPHSSSSNLARAKQMLRKVLYRNWGILLTFCLCIAILLFMSRQESEDIITAGLEQIHVIPAEKQEIMIAEIRKAETLKPLAERNIGKDDVIAVTETKADREPEGTISCPEDTFHVSRNENRPHYEHNDIFDEPAEERRRSGKLKFSLDGNFGRSADGRIQTLFPTSNPGQTGTTYPSYPGIGNTSSGIPGTTTPPDSGYEQGGNGNTEGGNGSSGPGSVTKFRHALPISLNAAVTYSFADRWMLTSGLRYTYLHSDITNIYDGSEYGQDIHYLGIPLKLSWTFWESYHMKSYVSAGAAFEFPIYSRIGGRRLDAPCQWSAGMGIGLQYDITPHIGIYIEPEVNRYFDNGSRIETVRSERPLTLTLPIGIRFSL